jgi:hypothetical protein
MINTQPRSSKGRSSIGENPLDALLPEKSRREADPLDSLVAVPRSGKRSGVKTEGRKPAARTGSREDGLAGIEKRLNRLEAHIRKHGHETEGLALVDKEGNVRAALKAEGGPSLSFYDAEGKKRISLGLSAEGKPRLLLMDDEEKVRAALDVESTGSPALNLFDTQERIRVALDVLPDGTPGLIFFDAEGRPTRKSP